MNMAKIADKIMQLGYYLLFILVPLVLTPWNFELFEFNKMLVTYALTGLIVLSWTLKVMVLGRFSWNRTVLDIPILLFTFSQFVSAIFSMDPHVSWFGYYSRFNGGMFSVICYALLYFAFTNNFYLFPNNLTNLSKPTETVDDSGKFIYRLLLTNLFTGMLVAIYGVLERLGIDKHLWVQDVQSRVFSTLGQPNWLGAYMAALLPISIALAIKYPTITKIDDLKSTKKPGSWHIALLPYIFWGIVSLLFFSVLLFTRSRSALGGFIVADFILLLLLAIKFVRFQVIASASTQHTLGSTFKLNPDIFLIIKKLVLVHVLMLVIVSVNGTHISKVDKYIKLENIINLLKPTTQTAVALPTAPVASGGTLLETGGTESGEIRKLVWSAAITAWRASGKTILIGTGTESFAWAFFRYRPQAHNMVSEWDFLYNKAHNEFLNYLTTTGAIGLGSYIFLLSVFCFWFIKKFINPKLNPHNESLSGSTFTSDGWILKYAIFSGWFSILVTNFIGFSVVIMQLLLFLLPAFIFGMTQDTKNSSRKYLTVNRSLSIPLSIILTIGFLLLIYRLGVYWYADRLYATAYRLNKSNTTITAQNLLIQAVALFPQEPVYRNELSSALGANAILALEQGNATGASQLATQAIAQSDHAITISPNNVNFWKNRTKIYYAFAPFQPQFLKSAIESLEVAAKLSPQDPKIWYNLAILYNQNSEKQKAVETMGKAIELKPNYKDAYYGLFVLLTEDKKTDAAKSVIMKYLEIVDPKDKQFLELLNQK